MQGSRPARQIDVVEYVASDRVSCMHASGLAHSLLRADGGALLLAISRRAACSTVALNYLSLTEGRWQWCSPTPLVRFTLHLPLSSWLLVRSSDCSVARRAVLILNVGIHIHISLPPPPFAPLPSAGWRSCASEDSIVLPTPSPTPTPVRAAHDVARTSQLPVFFIPLLYPPVLPSVPPSVLCPFSFIPPLPHQHANNHASTNTPGLSYQYHNSGALTSSLQHKQEAQLTEADGISFHVPPVPLMNPELLNSV